MSYAFLVLAVIVLAHWLVIGKEGRRRSAEWSSRAWPSWVKPEMRATADYYYKWGGAIRLLVVLLSVFFVIIDH
jgi:hypothetical protein